MTHRSRAAVATIAAALTVCQAIAVAAPPLPVRVQLLLDDVETGQTGRLHATVCHGAEPRRGPGCELRCVYEIRAPKDRVPFGQVDAERVTIKFFSEPDEFLVGERDP